VDRKHTEDRVGGPIFLQFIIEDAVGDEIVVGERVTFAGDAADREGRSGE
jgi:hypothetical protein